MIFIRVKPRTSHERAIQKENWGENGDKEDEEVAILSNPKQTNPIVTHPILTHYQQVVRVESEHQVALIAPKESQAFKNSMNGVGKMTYRYVSSSKDTSIKLKSTLADILSPRSSNHLVDKQACSVR